MALWKLISLNPYERIVKFRHTLLVIFLPWYMFDLVKNWNNTSLHFGSYPNRKGRFHTDLLKQVLVRNFNPEWPVEPQSWSHQFPHKSFLISGVDLIIIWLTVGLDTGINKCSHMRSGLDRTFFQFILTFFLYWLFSFKQ